MTMSPELSIPANSKKTPQNRVAEEFDIRFPALEDPSQDQETFEATIDGKRQRLRIHDYDVTYTIPGLYEALVYDTLRCSSPQRVTELLRTVLVDWPDDMLKMRVLDLGAGNGIVAEELRKTGAPYVVGLDLLPQAAIAAQRDRPGDYDDYIVADLTEMSDLQRTQLQSHKFNALVTVAALGFGDIPPRAFAHAANLIADDGWLAMTIKEDFLHPSEDDSGFARLLQLMIRDRVIEMEAHLRYCHRISVTGERLFYVATVARKLADIPESMIRQAEAISHTVETSIEAAGHVATILASD